MTARFERDDLQEVIDLANEIWPDLDCVVVLVENLSEDTGLHGQTVFDNKPYTIEIDTDQHVSEKVDTLIHELAHCKAGYYSGHGSRWVRRYKELSNAYAKEKKKANA